MADDDDVAEDWEDVDTEVSNLKLAVVYRFYYYAT